MKKKRRSAVIRVLLIYLIAAAALITVDGTAQIRADDDPDDLLNYSFAVWVGSGFYKVSDANKRFAVLRMPMAFTLRPSQSDETEFRDRLGFRLLLPAVVAFEEETETNFRYGAAALVPGLEVQIPVNSYWTLKPFGQVGVGKDSDGGNIEYIYGGGARSLVSFSWEKFNFSIGNSLILAENRKSTKKETNGFSMLEAGLDIRHPIGLTIRDRQIDASIFFVASRFFNRVEFLEDGGDTERVNVIYTFGLTLGTDEPFSIWTVGLDRIGIEYRWGNAGFSGIGFNLGFPF